MAERVLECAKFEGSHPRPATFLREMSNELASNSSKEVAMRKFLMAVAYNRLSLMEPFRVLVFL